VSNTYNNKIVNCRLLCLQSEISRRREAEIQKLKKELELILVQQETSEASLRKRHQEIVTDLSDQIEQLNRNKSK
jgi:hypothetical protein